MDLLDPFTEIAEMLGNWVAQLNAGNFKSFVAIDRNKRGLGFKNIAAVDVVQLVVGAGSNLNF